MELEKSKKAYKCIRCNLHGLDVVMKNHSRTCPYLFCECEKCAILSDYRTSINKKRRLDRQDKCDEESPDQYSKLSPDYQPLPQFLSNDFIHDQLNNTSPVLSQQTTSPTLMNQKTSPTLVSRLKTDDGKGKRPKLVLLISPKQKQSSQEPNSSRQTTPMSSSTATSQSNSMSQYEIGQQNIAEGFNATQSFVQEETQINATQGFAQEETQVNCVVDQQMLSQNVSTSSSQNQQNLVQQQNLAQQQILESLVGQQNFSQQRVEPIQMSTLLFNKLNAQQNSNQKALETAQFSTSITGQPGLQQNTTIPSVPSNQNGFVPTTSILTNHQNTNLTIPSVSLSQNSVLSGTSFLTNHHNLISPLVSSSQNESASVLTNQQQNLIAQPSQNGFVLCSHNQQQNIVIPSISSEKQISQDGFVASLLANQQQNLTTPSVSTSQNGFVPCPHNNQQQNLINQQNSITQSSQNGFVPSVSISNISLLNPQQSQQNLTTQNLTVPSVSLSQNNFVLCPHNNSQQNLTTLSVSSEKQITQPLINQDLNQLPKPVDSSNHFSLVQSQHFPANSSLQQDFKSIDPSKNQPSTTLFQQSSLNQQQPRKTFQLVSNYSNPPLSQNEPTVAQLPQNQQQNDSQPSIPNLFNLNNEQLRQLLLSQSLMIVQLIMNQEV